MSEKQPEPYVTLKIFESGQVIVEYKEASVTTDIRASEFREILVMLSVIAILGKAVDKISEILDKVFKEEKEGARHE